MRKARTRQQSINVTTRFKIVDGRLFYRSPLSQDFVEATKREYSVNQTKISSNQIVYFLTYGQWADHKVTALPWDCSAARMNESWRSFTVNLCEDDYQALKEAVIRSGKTMSVFVRSAIKEKMKRERHDPSCTSNPQIAAHLAVCGA